MSSFHYTISSSTDNLQVVRRDFITPCVTLTDNFCKIIDYTKKSTKSNSYLIIKLRSKLENSCSCHFSIQKLMRGITLLKYLGTETRIIANLVDHLIKQHSIAYPISQSMKRICSNNYSEAVIDLISNNVIWDNNTNEALWYAVETGDLKLLKRSLEHGANPNYENHQKMTPLLLAAKNGWSEIVSILLEHGAKAQVIRGLHQHETPLSEALLHGDHMHHCLKALKIADDGFTESVMNLKLLGHLYSIQLEVNVLSENFELRGQRPRNILPEYIAAFESFLDTFIEEITKKNIPKFMKNLNPSEIKEVISNLKEIVPMLRSTQKFLNMTIDEIMTRLEQGDSVPLYGLVLLEKDPLGDSNRLHAWALYIVPNLLNGNFYVYRCNRGAGSGQSSGILSSSLSRKIVKKFIEKFLLFNQWKLQSKVEKNPLDYFDNMINNNSSWIYYQQSRQRIGNCCLVSLDSLARAKILHEFRMKYDTLKSMEMTKKIFNNFKRHFQQNTLLRHLENLKSFSIEATINLVIKIYKNVKNRIKYKYESEIIHKWLLEQWMNVAVNEEFRKLIAKTLSVTPGYLTWLLKSPEEALFYITEKNVEKEFSLGLRLKKNEYCKFIAYYILEPSHTIILETIKFDYIESLEILLKGNIDYQFPLDPSLDKDSGKSILEIAAKYHAKGCVDYLLENKTNLNKDKALLAASYGCCMSRKYLVSEPTVEDYAHVISSLLKAGADVNIEDNSGRTSLWNILMIMVGRNFDNTYINLVLLLLEKGARVSKKVESTPILFRAYSLVPIDVLRIMVDRLNIEMATSNENSLDLIKDGLGNTLIMYAALKGDLPVINLLLEKGASSVTETKKNEHRFAWMFALKGGHISIAEQLLGDISSIRWDDPKLQLLLNEIWFDAVNWETVEWLLAKDFDVNIQDNYGRTRWMRNSEFIFVTYKKNINIFRNSRINLNIVDREGRHILFYIIMSLHGKNYPVLKNVVLSDLVHNGIDFDHKDNNGTTALMVAASQGDLDAVKILVEAGAKVDLFDKLGRTAIDHAVQRCNISIRNYLLNFANGVC